MRRARLGICSVVVLIGCASQNLQPRIEAPRTLASGDALRYNDSPATPPSTAIGDALLTATREIAEHVHVPAPTADARLFKACEALARVVPREGVVEYSAVEFALQSNGIIEPSPHLLVVRGNLHDAASAVAQVRPQIGRILSAGPVERVGVGTFDTSDGGVMVVALLQSHIRTSPIPRSVAGEGHVDFSLDLDAGYRDPKVHVTRPTGEVEAVPVRTDADRFQVDLACGSATGKMQVDIVGIGQSGALAFANFPVWCNAEPPQSIDVDQRAGDQPANPHAAEQRLVALINHDRDQAGTAPLVWDEELAQIARAHSAEMQRGTSAVAGTGSVSARVRVVRKGFEVHASVARVYGVAEAHRGLLGFPDTRAMLMSPRMTRVAIGIVYGAEVAGGLREMFVTDVLTSSGP